jgi:hypothetical protein
VHVSTGEISVPGGLESVCGVARVSVADVTTVSVAGGIVSIAGVRGGRKSVW